MEMEENDQIWNEDKDNWLHIEEPQESGSWSWQQH